MYLRPRVPFDSRQQLEYFARVRPVFRRVNQTRPHRIVPNVEPLLVIGLLRPQDMIEAAFLPEWRAKIRTFQGLGNRILEGFHPFRQWYRCLSECGKKVRVIWHEHIASHTDAVPGSE